MTKTQYLQYLTTDHWQNKRREAFQHYGQVCNRCSRFATDIHHRTYSRLGRELMSDLELLCKKCYEAEHAKDPLKKKFRKKKPNRKITPVSYWNLKCQATQKIAAASGYTYDFLKDLNKKEKNRLAVKYLGRSFTDLTNNQGKGKRSRRKKQLSVA